MTTKTAPFILVTGGTGYIGSHTVVQLVNAGYRVLIVDNLSNSNLGVLERVKKLVKDPSYIGFQKLDLVDRDDVEKLFSLNRFDGVIHFAGMKAVGESKQIPMKYYNNNFIGSLILFETMAKYKCYNLVFSSSCTVYGTAKPPLTEDTQTGVGVTNAYGQTKFFIEEMLKQIYDSDKNWKIALLRYFNPVGAHPSGWIGEDPEGIPNCIMPFVLQVLVGRREQLTIFGDDYPTRDGTCIRDYIHVEDVARGHLDALAWLDSNKRGVIDVFNFGTGRGTSVKELVAALEKASGKKVKSVIGPRRAGDQPEAYCNPDKAKAVLGWVAKYSIDDMCEHAWLWQSKNPNGFRQ